MRRRVLNNDNLKVGNYQFVDMGLSVYWATCNIGATKPEEYGWYFQWAGTIAYNSDCTPVEGGKANGFNWNNSCPYWVSGYDANINTKWSKYTASDGYSSTGSADNKLILDPEDDAAHVHVGDDCRMPTKAEYSELISACNTQWVTNYNGTGINGLLFTLKSDSSKTLFFPASGTLYSLSWTNAGSFGQYWASTLSDSDSYNGAVLYSYSNGLWTSSASRCVGIPVRAVKPK